jgi:PAS domain S-box-containing protein
MRERVDYEQRYRQLVERLPAIVYRASVLSGDWHYVSPAIERVLGWTPAEWSRSRSRPQEPAI